MTKNKENNDLGILAGVFGRLTLLKPRINMKKVLEASVLGMVLALAVIFRVIRIRWGPYMDAYDPLFQYRVTEYVVKNGYLAWYNWNDALSWWPTGRDIPHSSYPGIPFSAAFLYNLLHALGVNVSVYNVCLFFPVFMAVLTCIAAYYLGRDLGGNTVGLFSAFFMATSRSFISRTWLGFFDTENIGIFGMTIIPLFFLRSMEPEKSLHVKVTYAIMSGFVLGYVFASWGAARYIVGLLTLFMLASFFTGLYNRGFTFSYGLTMGVGFLIAILAVPKLGFSYISYAENVLVLLLIASLIVYEALKDRVKAQSLLIAASVIFIILIIGFLALSSVGLITPIKGKFFRVIFPGGGTESPLYESVAEHRHATWSNFFSHLGIILIFGMLGTFFAIKKLNNKKLYAALFFLSGVYFAGSMSRLGLILSIPASLMGAYGLKGLIYPFVKLAKQREVKQRGRRRTRSQLPYTVSRELAIIFTILIFAATIPTFFGMAEASFQPTSLASSSVPVLLGGSYPQDWLQALSWMRDNLPNDAIVVSWWDYGYWIEALANKTTLADGATKGAKQIGRIGKIMMLNQSGSLPILKDYGATHIVVFNTFNPGDPQQQWPFGDNVKWQWMVSIATLNISDYYYEGKVTQKYFDSTLFRLMAMQPDTAFEPVYVSDYSYVLVYKIKYQDDQM